jgi:hypothetical protein
MRHLPPSVAGIALAAAVVVTSFFSGSAASVGTYRSYVPLLAADSAAPPILQSVPAGWPTTLQLGSRDQPGGAAAMKATAPFAFRYAYLSGGVNTDQDWTTWDSGGTYVTRFIADSVANSIIPVFSFYQIRQSAPGNRLTETPGVFANLGDATTMAASCRAAPNQ